MSMELNPKEYPILSKWNPEHLNKTLDNLSKKANPNKTEITESDKIWAATMLELDLQSQSGAIWEQDEQETPWIAHNRKMMEKMQRENIPWAESYPGELYPIETTED